MRLWENQGKGQVNPWNGWVLNVIRQNSLPSLVANFQEIFFQSRETDQWILYQQVSRPVTVDHETTHRFVWVFVFLCFSFVWLSTVTGRETCSYQIHWSIFRDCTSSPQCHSWELSTVREEDYFCVAREFHKKFSKQFVLSASGA